MPEAAPKPKSRSKAKRPSDTLTSNQLLEMYCFARLAREIEERLVILFRRPDESYIVPLGKAAVRREGEVIDLRSPAPLDQDAILESVAKTNRVLLLHEATLTGGIGGELAAIISEHAFEYLDAPVTRVASLDAPVTRVASLDAPVPCAPPLETAFLPGVSKVVEAAEKLVAY